MSTWYKVKWIPPLFAAFDEAFPRRTKAQDGTIGDTAHQRETSGHNPDDTPGVRAERSDADSKPEVRAADVTSDLRRADGTRVPMIEVVRSVLSTPRDRDRLIYIICDGKIWRRANGWRQETYTGADKHFQHAHFSGEPSYDEDAELWQSVLAFVPKPPPPLEDPDMAYDDEATRKATATNEVVFRALIEGKPTVSLPPYPAGTAWQDYPVWLVNAVNDLLGRPAAGPPSDAQVDALAERLFDKLATKFGDALITALTDPRAIEAYRQGANAAEDS